MVEKISFLFPGQGSQYVGMGKSAYEQNSTVKNLFSEANQILGYNITTLMFDGPEEKLKDTSVTQPALFLASVAGLEVLKEFHLTPSWVAGHSLGEYSALYAAGVLSFKDALTLVNFRGKAMSEAAQSSHGSMAAIIGLSEEKCSEICAAFHSENAPCVPANFNSENQLVISGASDSVSKAADACRQAGAAKVVILNVSGAFHSPLMQSAVQTMEAHIMGTPFQNSRIPVITNVDAEPTESALQFQEKLIKQIDHAVLWNKSAKKLLELGAEVFIEVGAGRVLGTMMKKLDRKKTVLQTDDVESIRTFFSNMSTSQKGV